MPQVTASNFSYTFVTDDRNIRFSHGTSVHPKREHFALHTHNDNELFIFIKGDMHFVVEGVVYPLKPYDALLLRAGEMHDIYPVGNSTYERVVFNIEDSFFDTFHCTPYKEMFTERPLAQNNLIPGELISLSDIPTLLTRIEKYHKDGGRACDTVISCALVEVLHALHHMQPLEKVEEKQNSTVFRLIDYINKNLDTDLNLEALSEKFFVSKYHLCRIFRAHTGYTINHYITQKRLHMVLDLCRSGETITSACVTAGFSGYSAFYKAYIKAHGVPPKSGLFADIK